MNSIRVGGDCRTKTAFEGNICSAFSVQLNDGDESEDRYL